MGIINRFKSRIVARQQRSRSRYESGREERLLKLKVERENLKLRKEERGLKLQVSGLKKQERAAKLAPLKQAVGSFKQHARKAATRQKKALPSNKDLFGTTKTADQLLFGTKAKAAKPKKKKLKKVYYEYK